MSTSGGNELCRPKIGTHVQLRGLKAKPELNGCGGVVIKEFDAETGRCGIQLDDGIGVNVKPSNIVVVTPEHKLEWALAKLEAAGGKEEESDDEEDGVDRPASKDPEDYLNELLAVGDARYELGQYGKAGNLYSRAYYATIMKSTVINPPELFPVAHKMIQAWTKSDAHLSMAHGMAQQTCMMPGCPSYIRKDMNEAARVMSQKGMQIQNIMSPYM